MKALIVGRFQPFHKGHRYLIEKADNDFEEVIIGIGSSQKSRSERNPLTFEERRSVIEECYPGIRTFGVKDLGHDLKWVEEIESKLKNLGIKEPEREVTAVGMNDWTRRCFRKAGYPLQTYKVLKPGPYSGSEIRNRILNRKDWSSLVPNCASQKLQDLDFEKILREEIN